MKCEIENQLEEHLLRNSLTIRKYANDHYNGKILQFEPFGFKWEVYEIFEELTRISDNN